MEETIKKAELLILESRYVEALELLEEILEEEPDHREALRLSGIAYMEHGEAEKAVKALDFHIKRWGREPKALEALGCAHFKLGNYGRSRELLREAEESEPGSASIKRNLGVVYQQLGDMDEAYRSLSISNELAPGDFRTIYALAMACLEYRRVDEAAGLLEELLRLSVPSEFRTLARVHLKRIGRL